MMKKLSLLIVLLTMTTGLQAIPANAQIDGQNGGIIEWHGDETSAPNFFLEDINEPQMPLHASHPDTIPCAGVITSEYGWRRLSRSHARMHLGVDIAAPTGSPVKAPADGKVLFAGYKGGYGLTVILDHGGELTTLFGHNSRLFVSEGDVVKRGQEISLVGTTGHSTGPHVHYEVRIEGQAVNPTRFF